MVLPMACGPNACDFTTKREFRGLREACSRAPSPLREDPRDGDGAAAEPRSARRVEEPVPVATVVPGIAIPRPVGAVSFLPTRAPTAAPDLSRFGLQPRRVVETDRTPLGTGLVVSGPFGTVRVPAQPDVMRAPLAPVPSLQIRPDSASSQAPRKDTPAPAPATPLGPFAPITPQVRPDYCSDPAFAGSELCRPGPDGRLPALSTYCTERLRALGLDGFRRDELCAAELTRGSVSSLQASPVAAPSVALSTVRPSGAPAEDNVVACARAFLGLGPDAQRGVMLSADLLRYPMARVLANDLQHGVPSTAATFLRWLDATFSRGDAAVNGFCAAVTRASAAGIAPGGDPDPSGGQMMQDVPYVQAGPSDPILDEPSAWKMFWSMPREAQTNILSTSFGRRSYPATLAVVLGQGRSQIQNVPVLDLFYAWASRLRPDAPERTLFRFDVGEWAKRLGWMPQPAGDVAPAPRTPATGTRTPAPGQSAPPASGQEPQAVPPGFTPASWAQLQAADPATAARLWQAWQSQPNTYQQVSGTVMAAADRVLQGIQSDATAELARARLDAEHRQAMAQIALQAQQAAAQREMARQGAVDAGTQAALAAQVAALQMTAQSAAAAATTPPTTASDAPMSTGAKLGLAALVVGVAGGAAYGGYRYLHADTDSKRVGVGSR